MKYIKAFRKNGDWELYDVSITDSKDALSLQANSDFAAKLMGIFKDPAFQDYPIEKPAGTLQYIKLFFVTLTLFMLCQRSATNVQKSFKRIFNHSKTDDRIHEILAKGFIIEIEKKNLFRMKAINVSRYSHIEAKSYFEQLNKHPDLWRLPHIRQLLNGEINWPELVELLKDLQRDALILGYFLKVRGLHDQHSH